MSPKADRKERHGETRRHQQSALALGEGQDDQTQDQTNRDPHEWSHDPDPSRHELKRSACATQPECDEPRIEESDDDGGYGSESDLAR